MLNKYFNFQFLLGRKKVKKEIENTDLMVVGRVNKEFEGGYEPYIIPGSDLLNQVKSAAKAEAQNEVANPSNKKVYRAQIFQPGGAVAPTATVFENTIGDIVWSYDSAGNYYATLNGAFPSGKVWFGSQNQNSLQKVFMYEDTVNRVGLATDSGTDGNVICDIEIVVYP